MNKQQRKITENVVVYIFGASMALFLFWYSGESLFERGPKQAGALLMSLLAGTIPVCGLQIYRVDNPLKDDEDDSEQ